MKTHQRAKTKKESKRGSIQAASSGWPVEYPDALTLETLRQLRGHPLPVDSLSTKRNEIRPGVKRKLDFNDNSQHYVIRPTKWRVPRELRAAEEIARLIDQRSLPLLHAQSLELRQQIFDRAALGDAVGIQSILNDARAAIEALELLEKTHPKSLGAIATKSASWPVLLSPNPQDLKRAKAHIESLGVASDYETRRLPGQKLDPNSFWTRLADEGTQACRDAGAFVPHFEAHCKGVRARTRIRTLWGTRIRNEIYGINSNHIVIADWEKECAKLSGQIIKDNFTKWWNVVRRYVLEYWHGVQPAYDEALRQIAHADKEEWRRRSMALDRVNQALRDLAELR